MVSFATCSPRYNTCASGRSYNYGHLPVYKQHKIAGLPAVLAYPAQQRMMQATLIIILLSTYLACANTNAICNGLVARDRQHCVDHDIVSDNYFSLQDSMCNNTQAEIKWELTYKYSDPTLIIDVHCYNNTTNELLLDYNVVTGWARSSSIVHEYPTEIWQEGTYCVFSGCGRYSRFFFCDNNDTFTCSYQGMQTSSVSVAPSVISTLTSSTSSNNYITPTQITSQQQPTTSSEIITRPYTFSHPVNSSATATGTTSIMTESLTLITSTSSSSLIQSITKVDNIPQTVINLSSSTLLPQTNDYIYLLLVSAVMILLFVVIFTVFIILFLVMVKSRSHIKKADCITPIDDINEDSIIDASIARTISMVTLEEGLYKECPSPTSSTTTEDEKSRPAPVQGPTSPAVTPDRELPQDTMQTCHIMQSISMSYIPH